MRPGARTRSLVAALFATIALAGCKLRRDAMPDDRDDRRTVAEIARRAVERVEGELAASPPADPASAPPQVDADVLLAHEVDALVRECRNPFATRIAQSWVRYSSWLGDAKNGPTGHERTVLGLYAITADPKSCRKAVDAAKALAPATPALDLAAEAYASALEALVPVVDAASLYYEHGEYKDDDFARGRALHPDLVAAFDAFRKADAALAAQLDAAQDGLDARELARLAGDEQQRGRWHLKRTAVLAKEVLRAGSFDVAKIDVAALSAAEQRFEDARLAFARWCEAHPTDAALDASYLRELQQLDLAARELVARARDRRPYTLGERMNLGGWNEWMVAGSPGRLAARYDAVIEAFNAIGAATPR